jgi:hypothetical protein
MDTKESRKTAVKLSSIQEKSVEKPSKAQHAYFAVRQCDFLKGPAIFFAWEDCCFYIDQKENEGEVECQGFDMILDAVEWIHERAESVAGTGAASHVSRTSPATTNNGTTAKATVRPSDDSKNNVLPTPSSAAPSKATKPIKRQMRAPAGAPPNAKQTQLFPQVHAPFLPYPPFPMPPMIYPMMPPMMYPTMPPTMPPRMGYAAPYTKPMTRMQKACRPSLTTPTPQAKTPPKTAAKKWRKLSREEFVLISKKSYPTWEERLQQYREYKTKHGKGPVKNSENGLGSWAAIQRQRYRMFKRGEPSLLKQKQADRLTEVGFTCDTIIKIPELVHPRRSWDESYADIIAYKVRHIGWFCQFTLQQDNSNSDRSSFAGEKWTHRRSQTLSKTRTLGPNTEEDTPEIFEWHR